MQAGKQYAMESRSVNAWVISRPVMDPATRQMLFVKVADTTKGDPILVDAINSAGIQHLATARPDLATWTMTLRNVHKCRVDISSGAKSFVIDPKIASSRYVALEYAAIAASPEPRTMAQMGPLLADYIQRLIDEARQSGLTHNDMHHNNVMYDGKKLTMIDYGRVMFNIAPPRRPLGTALAKQIEALDSNVQPHTVENLSLEMHQYVPFTSASVVAKMEGFMWVPDVIMFSTWKYLDLLKVGAPPVSFLSSKQGAGSLPIFITQFRDADDLLKKVMTSHHSMRPLLPGLVLHALFRKMFVKTYNNRHSYDKFMFRNYAIMALGGAMLANFFSGKIANVSASEYMSTIAFAFDSAGIDAGLFRVQKGGADSDESTLPLVPESEFPTRDLVADLPGSDGFRTDLWAPAPPDMSVTASQWIANDPEGYLQDQAEKVEEVLGRELNSLDGGDDDDDALPDWVPGAYQVTP